MWSYLIVCERQMGLWAVMGFVLSNTCLAAEKLSHCPENLFSFLLGFQINRGFGEQPNRNLLVTSQRMIKGWIKTHGAKLFSWLFLWGHAKASLQGFVVRSKFVLPVLPGAFKFILHYNLWDLELKIVTLAWGGVCWGWGLLSFDGSEACI